MLDDAVAPTLRLSDKFEDTIILKSGASTVVEVPFVASPKPSIKWTWKTPVEGSVETTPPARFKPDTAVGGLTSLPLNKVKREDAGDYTVTIANEIGEVSVTVHLIVLDKPSPPRNPHVTENTGESVLFHWEEPEFTGVKDTSVTPLTYVVEMREATQRVGKPVRETKELSTAVEALTVDKNYVFSVAARNEVGQSEFVETKPVSTKLDFGPPPTPVNVRARVQPEKAPVKEQSIEVTWEMPSDTAAVPADVVTEFVVEMRPKDGRWVEVPVTNLTATHVTLPTTGMKEFTDYEFRVTAKNKAGKSKPSEPSNAIQLGRSCCLTDAQFECGYVSVCSSLSLFLDSVERRIMSLGLCSPL